MSCPCRLAAGNREKDADIICPCQYRPEDIKEYGSCYCNLYVSPEWNESKIEHQYVPERSQRKRADFEPWQFFYYFPIIQDRNVFYIFHLISLNKSLYSKQL